MDLFNVSDQILSEVQTWDGVTLELNRSGWTEIRFHRMVFGHLHHHGSLDVLLPKPLKIQSVLAGDAEPHPNIPTSGWVTILLGDQSKTDQALRVLARAYDALPHRTDRFGTICAN
ncbi:luciferase family protein [Planctomicrobium sp. SH668]|uniref:luciferase domain-containing protein n=1 Tax=Planctomicrobium sp. SH668 TaxID=3448126 RepID=UPI003F5C60F6